MIGAWLAWLGCVDGPPDVVGRWARSETWADEGTVCTAFDEQLDLDEDGTFEAVTDQRFGLDESCADEPSSDTQSASGDWDVIEVTGSWVLALRRVAAEGLDSGDLFLTEEANVVFVGEQDGTRTLVLGDGRAYLEVR